MTIRNDGGLLVAEGAGDARPLGYLMVFPGRGAYDAELGKVDVAEGDVDLHNRTLDAALVEGLDENCGVGQGNTFYVRKHGAVPAVATWLGTVLGPARQVRRTRLRTRYEFARNGRRFVGEVLHGEECGFFERVA